MTQANEEYEISMSIAARHASNHVQTITRSIKALDEELVAVGASNSVRQASEKVFLHTVAVAALVPISHDTGFLAATIEAAVTVRNVTDKPGA